MRRGFTILEMLVAALLLGMLMSIVTMIFTQSSVAWRLGAATVMDLNVMRNRMGAITENADNAFVYAGSVYEHVSPLKEDGSIRADRPFGTLSGDASLFQGAAQSAYPAWSGQNKVLVVNDDGGTGHTFDSYVVNVMSGGPNNDIMDWQAIWSYPDDFE